MRTPWVRQFAIPNPGGGVIRVRQWGDLDGPAILFHHGTPSTSIAAPGGWRAAADLGLHVVTFDRPGYGSSTRQEGHTVADAARWSALIADECGIGEFAVMGTSYGGPHAAATAALLPERVTRLCIDVGLGPVPQYDFDPRVGMLPNTVAEIEATWEGEHALREFIGSLGNLEESLESWMALLPPSDHQVLARADVREEEAVELEEWTSNGIEGWIDDDLALYRLPWGFDPAEIAQPTLLIYGEADVLVPATHGVAYRDLLPHAVLKIVGGGGHWLRDHEPAALTWAAETKKTPEHW